MGKAKKNTLTIMEAVPPETPVKPVKARGSRQRRKNGLPDYRTFAAARSRAEKRLPMAIREQAEAASRYAVLGAEISYLQATVVALRNQQRAMVMPQFMTAPPAPPTPPGYPQPRNVPMETIMSDQPIPAAVRAPQEQAVLVPAAVQAGPPTSIQVPVPELPYVPGRAGGGALGMNVDSDPDEDEHLKSSAMAGGQWV